MAALCRSSAACPGRSRLRVKRLVLSPAMGTGRRAGGRPSLRPLVRKRNWAPCPRRRRPSPSPLLPGPCAARRPRARSPEGRPRLVPPAEALRRGAAPAASLTALPRGLSPGTGCPLGAGHRPVLPPALTRLQGGMLAHRSHSLCWQECCLTPERAAVVRRAGGIQSFCA